VVSVYILIGSAALAALRELWMRRRTEAGREKVEPAEAVTVA
jgi:hypothetical protein